MLHDTWKPHDPRETAAGGGCGCGAGGCGGGIGKATATALGDIEAELRAFERTERQRLGLESDAAHWNDANPRRFARSERGGTTLLFGGLTAAHDALIEAALRRLGYKARALPCPDVAALQTGKEFGNRGQCNPTYFTVGNLVRNLQYLRDAEGLSTEQIVRDYAFITFGACGPCRFGTYVTEFRKALRDSGFAGFRVMALSQEGPKDKQDPDSAGLETGMEFYVLIVKCLMAGDIVNMLGYRIRPYEVEPGATDAAIAESKAVLCAAVARGSSIARALFKARRAFARVRIDRLQAKPKVSIIGEFWAMTTEGDGNYRLQRFLEQEGAECDIQIITAWVLYILWCMRFDIRESTLLRRRTGELDRFEGIIPRLGLLYVWLGEQAIRGVFHLFAYAAGLNGHVLPDMDEIARLAHDHYPNQLRGGEGHMEVGKVIATAVKNKAHMVLSVKPFGCMPSAGVSDGVQSVVAARFPEIEFLPIETTGDSAVNAYSRVQMALFRARARAQAEFAAALDDTGLTVQQAASRKAVADPLRYPGHRVAGTAANAVYETG